MVHLFFSTLTHFHVPVLHCSFWGGKTKTNHSFRHFFLFPKCLFLVPPSPVITLCCTFYVRWIRAAPLLQAGTTSGPTPSPKLRWSFSNDTDLKHITAGLYCFFFIQTIFNVVKVRIFCEMCFVSLFFLSIHFSSLTECWCSPSGFTACR